MLNTLDIGYLARGSVNSPANISRTKKYIKEAFETQMRNGGYSFVEIVSPCPTNWRMEPIQALKRIDEEVFPVFPVGEFIKKGERI